MERTLGWGVRLCHLSPKSSSIESEKAKVKSLSRVRLFATPRTVAYQAPPSMGFSRQEYWSGLPFPPPGHLPDPGIEPRSPALQADTLLSESPGKPFIEHIPKSLHQAWPKCQGWGEGKGRCQIQEMILVLKKMTFYSGNPLNLTILCFFTHNSKMLPFSG